MFTDISKIEFYGDLPGVTKDGDGRVLISADRFSKAGRRELDAQLGEWKSPVWVVIPQKGTTAANGERKGHVLLDFNAYLDWHLSRAPQRIKERIQERLYCFQYRAVQLLANPTDSGLAADKALPDDADHDDAFKWVWWNGVPYTFTAKQSLMIRVLWLAAERGYPVVHGSELLEAADIVTENSDRIDPYFQRSKAWKEGLIVRGERRCTYRLDPLAGLKD